MNSRELAWLVRRHGVEMTHLSHGSHIASVLSVADILAVLYNDVASLDCHNPKWEGRDRIVLSKGHSGAAIYATLAEKGFFPIEQLKTHYADGSVLSGHVSHKGVPGVELSTGSLGHGICIAEGIELGLKLDNKENHVFVVCGDGECDEGSVWECALFSNHFNLDNFTVIIDHNKMQSLDYCENTLSLNPFVQKWQSFGWNVYDIDGHDHNALRETMKICKQNKNGKPNVIVANTIKGKGISFMEMNILWHYRFPHEGEEYESALKELKENKPTGVVYPYELK